jgi:hypothetical protein
MWGNKIVKKSVLILFLVFILFQQGCASNDLSSIKIQLPKIATYPSAIIFQDGWLKMVEMNGKVTPIRNIFSKTYYTIKRTNDDEGVLSFRFESKFLGFSVMTSIWQIDPANRVLTCIKPFLFGFINDMNFDNEGDIEYSFTEMSDKEPKMYKIQLPKNKKQTVKNKILLKERLIQIEKKRDPNDEDNLIIKTWNEKKQTFDNLLNCKKYFYDKKNEIIYFVEDRILKQYDLIRGNKKKLMDLIAFIDFEFIGNGKTLIGTTADPNSKEDIYYLISPEKTTKLSDFLPVGKIVWCTGSENLSTILIELKNQRKGTIQYYFFNSTNKEINLVNESKEGVKTDIFNRRKNWTIMNKLWTIYFKDQKKRFFVNIEKQKFNESKEEIPCYYSGTTLTKDGKMWYFSNDYTSENHDNNAFLYDWNNNKFQSFSDLSFYADSVDDIYFPIRTNHSQNLGFLNIQTGKKVLNLDFKNADFFTWLSK